MAGGWRVAAAARKMVIAAGVVCAQVFVGLLSSRSWAHVIGGACLVVLTPLLVFSPIGVATLAFPGSIATWRLGGGAIDLSFADAILVVCEVICLPKAAWRDPRFKRVATTAGIYLLMIGIPLAANPTVKGLFEWLHRLHFLIGALIVGSAVLAAGKARLALRLYLVAALTLAVAAIIDTVGKGFEPAYPLGLQKNPAGFLIMAGLIVSIVADRVVQVAAPLRLPMNATLLLGVLACQSRGSAATFVVILFVNAVRTRKRGLLLPALGAVALVAMIWASTSEQLAQDASTARFNPLETRKATYSQTIDLWEGSPLFGEGLRYWNDVDVQRENGFALTEPHNLVIAALGESGLFGAAGVLGLNVLLVLGLRSRRDTLGQLAFYLVIARFVAGLADIYWVAGSGTLPWLVLGLASAEAPAAGAPRDAPNAPGAALTTRAALE